MKPATGFINGNELSGTVQYDTEVCIVGSGAGGSVAAAVLAQSGRDVLVVEEGGHHTRLDFKMREDTAYPMLYQEDAGRATKDLAILILQGRSVGGSTTVNWTTCFRTPEHVIEHWQQVHGVNGFKYADLVPHWETVEKRLNVAEIPLVDTNRNNRTLYDGCQKLGYQVATIRRNVKSCFKSGYCGMGCPIDAKQSMIVTYLPDAVHAGASVLSRCRVDRFEGTDGAFRLTGTLIGPDDHTPTGGTVEIRAKRLILSSGAIGTPSILLRSGFNAGGRVGRRTWLHPVVAQYGLYKEPILGFYGAPQSAASHHFAQRGDEMGFFLESAPVHPMLAALANPGIGQDHLTAMEHLPNGAAHIALMIDGFHPEEIGGTVTLRKSGAPLIDYQMPERLWRAMREAVKTLARIQLATGATESHTAHDPPAIIRSEADLSKIDALPFAPNKLTVFSAHVMGGAMMGDDPSHGIVSSEDGSVHGLKGVHVLDGSLFPTSLGVNPQLSIYGLSHLLATRLAERWKSA